MKEGRKPDYPEKTPDDELLKMPHTKARKFKPQTRLEPTLEHRWQARKADMLTITTRVTPNPTLCCASDGGAGRAYRAPSAPRPAASPERASQPHGEHLHGAGPASGSAQAAHRPRHVSQPGQGHQEWVGVILGG